jgi:hypothetical protein
MIPATDSQLLNWREIERRGEREERESAHAHACRASKRARVPCNLLMYLNPKA